MRKNIGLSLVLSAFVLTACSKESPELIPCMCDGNADSTLGWFDCMCEPSKKKPVRRISYLQDKQKVRYQSLIIDEEQYNAYALLHQNRNAYAPIKLENVDFRIKKSRKYDDFDTKLGDYHFRIFGCRRETKNAFLNQGRSMQKDMHFFDVFYETLNDYYPVVVEPANVYYPDSDKVQPEYLITAEITDYFMNICDEFDWKQAKNKKLRNGSSEMTVVWRIMNLAKDQVYCRGTTTGYGQIMEGEPNGENLLVERAFEDALTKLPEISCLNSILSKRLSLEEIEAQLARVYRYENCDDCFKTQYAGELQGISILQECDTPSAHDGNRGSLILEPVTTPLPCTEEPCPTPAENSGTKGGYRAQTLVTGPNGELYMTSGGTKNTGYITEGGVRDTNFTIIDECQNVQIVNEECAVEECPVVRSADSISLSDDYFIDIPLEVDELTTKEIVEDGGVTGSGTALELGADECIKSNGIIITEDGCVDGTGTVITDEECLKAKNMVVEDGCVDGNGTIIESEECMMPLREVVFEDGGATGSGMIITGEECVKAKNAIIAEDGGTSGTGTISNIEINEIGESAFAAVNNQFCIVNNPPFEDLNPYNLYKLRASVVSVENAAGKKGAGLIIAENMVLTSADLIQKDNNLYNLETVNGKKFKASAFRVNPSKNVAVLLLDKPTVYQPLPMALTLPEVNKDILMTLGLLNFDDEGENYLDNEGRVVGYRWSEERGAEIIVDTFVQTVTLGGALIDQKGNIIGIAHETKKSDNSPDLFIPIETALKSLGLEICGQRPAVHKPKPVQIYTPIADAIDNSKADKSPKPMKGKKRK